MDPKEFLAAVLPWDDGFATIHWQIQGQKGFPGKACRTVDEALQLIASLQGKHVNVYFCLTRQTINNGKRSRATASGVGCLWGDADVNPDDPRCYATLAEAVAGILRFCLALGIPKPSLLVASGGGLHPYWLSIDKKMPIEEWEPYAEGLKNAIKTMKLPIKDTSVIADAARVLRVPGTLNYKYDPPRPVRVLTKYSSGERYDFKVAMAKLLEFTTPAKPAQKLNLGPVPAAFKDLPLTPLGGGIEGPPPLSLATIKTGCAWLREAHDTGGKNLSGNMQWNLLILCATFLEGGNEVAHQLVNQHPGYNRNQTEDVWHRKNRERGTKNLGWPSCRAIQDSGCGHCATCPHFALGKSPLHLGLGVTQNAEIFKKEDLSEEELDEEIKNLGGTRPKDLRLPEGYAVDEEGRICKYLESETTGKNVVPARLLHLLKTQIKDPTLQFQGGQFGLGFTANTNKDNWHEVFVNSSNLVGPELIKFLLGKFVLPNTEDPEAIKLLGRFPVSWIDKIRKVDEAIKDSGTMGWRYEDGKKVGFVYGSTLYHESGAKFSLVATTDDEFRSFYQPVGSREVWLEACKLLTDRKRPELDILISVAFAAPLTAFSGTLYGATLSTWGDPGTSKSTAQQVAAALFGHPKQTRESLNSTPKSIQGRLGRTRNLAAYWDDIQSEQHQDNLFNTMFVTAGGTEGGRLNSDSTMKNRLDWQTLLVACSNASFIEYLTRKQRSTTAGMRRVFEFEFNKDPRGEPGMINALDASRVFAKLEHNYGVLGAEYAEILAREHVTINELVGSITKDFTRSVNGSGDESYWWGLCGVLLAGATLANRLGAELDVAAMETFLRKAFLDNRRIRGSEGTEGGSIANTEVGLVQFLNEYLGRGHAIYVNTSYKHRHQTLVVMKKPEPRCPIFIQVIREEYKILVSRSAMKAFLERSEIHSRQVFDGLVKFFGATEVKITLGAGTDFAQSQERCYEIPVPPDGSVMQDIIDSNSGISAFKPS